MVISRLVLSTCFFLMISILLGACTTMQLKISKPFSPYLSADGGVAGEDGGADLYRCARLFVDTEVAILSQGLQDVQTQRITGFPYLRTDRHLSSYRYELTDVEQLRFWAEQLRLLDIQSRLPELQNLHKPQMLSALYGETWLDALDVCGTALLAADLNNQDRVDELVKNASAPDSYSGLARVLGMYPVTGWFVSWGITRLQRKIQQRFDEEPAALPSGVIRYTPSDDVRLDTDVIAEMISASRDNPLGFPLLSDEHSKLLFEHFSPVLEIQTLTDDDRPGSPFLTDAGTAAVDTSDPVVYQKLSYTRLDNEVLPQLNYVFWFPARPVQGAFDLLGGLLDGITLRITLGSDGSPVMHDAMHNCGCYHMYFPSAGRVRPASSASEAAEPLLIPKAVEIAASDRLLLQIEALSHYIIGVDVTDDTRQSPSVVYRTARYDELRSLELSQGGRRSLFGRDGLVPGTARRERWLLWPMGVLEPGAMRQWGHHATAFVGRRHFDDPFLLETYFERLPVSEALGQTVFIGK